MYTAKRFKKKRKKKANILVGSADSNSSANGKQMYISGTNYVVNIKCRLDSTALFLV